MKLPRPGRRRLSLPAVLGPDGFAIEQIEDAEGRPRGFGARSRGVIRSSCPSWPRSPLLGRDTCGWSIVQPGRFRLIAEPGSSLPANGELVTEQGVPIVFDPRDWSVVQEASESRGGLEAFDLAIQAARLATHAGFDRLISLPLVRDIELLEHQIRTAKTVLRRFRGRAMLCDEVGLGKTIEAGLVLSELMIRGLARSVLVLVPPSLIEQWQGEMRRKFSIELISHDDPSFRERGPGAWNEFDRVIASIHTAKREPHRGVDPGPAVGHGHRGRGASPSQSQHPGLEVRQ